MRNQWWSSERDTSAVHVDGVCEVDGEPGMVCVTFSRETSITIELHRVLDRDEFLYAIKGMVPRLGGPQDAVGWHQHIEKLLAKSRPSITEAAMGICKRIIPLSTRRFRPPGAGRGWGLGGTRPGRF